MSFASRPKPPEIPEITITPPDEIWTKQSAPAPYVSFGDHGLTASVGTYGSLLRICCPVQNLEYKNLKSSDPNVDDRTPCDTFRSKIVCLEYSGEKAWFVTYRSAQFLRDAENIDSGFGLRLGDGIHPLQSSVKFVENRWPVIRYGTKEGFLVTTRLWCQDGAIVQQMRVDRASGPEEINLNLNLRLFMQDLDYISPSENKKIKEYQSNTPGNEHRILLMGNDEEKSQIGVLIELFKDEQPHMIPDFPENRQSRRAEEVPEPVDSLWSIPFAHKFEGQQTHVEYTLTLKLQMAPSHLAWKLLESSSLSNRPFPFQSGQESKAGPFSDDIEAKVNWHCHWNLEHILSVCSIPLYSSPSKVPETLKTTGTGYSCPSTPTALTCGDFGDHRVSVSGSYFAFMFMLEMYKSLDRPDSQKSPWLFENQTVNGLRKRIRETCKGHLDWIFNLDLDAACSTNLWINGKMIDSYSETSVPKNCPTNMPYHIIKVTEFLRVIEDFAGKESIYPKLAILCKGWFSRLKATKNIRTPTWEHVEGSDIPSYRLGDHIWIWKALKGIEDIMNEMSFKSANGFIHPDERQEFYKLKDRISTLKAERLRGHADEDEATIFFNSEDLRRENLKRFTIKNDIFNKRMLSVTRSASETRFLLHSRDTVLCYGMGWDFFKSHDEPLRELMNIQTKHDDSLSEESYWKNPLRYGLALLMSREDWQLESIYSPDRMEQHARKLLLSSSSENGLFPGQLNDDKQAMLFEDEIDRDFYFHVGFEIPYILLRCQRPKKIQQLDPDEDESFTPENPLASEPSAHRDSRSQNEQNYSSRNFTKPAFAPMTLKRQIPYGVFVDLNKIVDVAEEWLFKDPDFLGFAPPQEPNVIKGTIIAASHRLDLDYDMVWDDMELMKGRHSAIMLDIRKSRKKKLTAQEKCTVVKTSRYGLNPLYFKDRLLAKRRLDESKKRLINVKSPKWSMAIACYVATPECDRSNLASFLQRHGNTKSSFFHDDVVIGFNTWTTELHCRFFRAVEKDGNEWKELQEQRSAGGLDIPADQRCSRQLAAKLCQTLGHGCYIVDDVFSFMMVGDWCDRYWTCHVLETSTVRSDLFRTDWRQNNPNFPQRKVLELILFNKVLENIHRSAIDILKRVERDPRSSSSDMSEELYSNVSFKDKKQELLDETFQVLRILKDSITGIKDLIEDWKRRESSQGRERPRWTRSDEQKYRKIIQTHENELAKHDREINLLLSRIDFLIALVNNEKSLSQSRDVTRFTYATVFFLPVGLAVSLFSMSGAPGRTAILEVVITAIVALSVTVFILWSAIKAPTSMNVRHLPMSFSWLMQAFSADYRKHSVTSDGEEPSSSGQRLTGRSLWNMFSLSNLKRRNTTKDSQSDSAA